MIPITVNSTHSFNTSIIYPAIASAVASVCMYRGDDKPASLFALHTMQIETKDISPNHDLLIINCGCLRYVGSHYVGSYSTDPLPLPVVSVDQSALSRYQSTWTLGIIPIFLLA